jgi:hypothetical protein
MSETPGTGAPSDSGDESKSVDGKTAAPTTKKKFLNGWTSELEDMMADWADKAACYRWMHEQTSKLYKGRDRYFNIPNIILSGVTAGANFALNSIVGDDKEMMRWAQLGLGGASLVTGLIQTLMNFYSYAKESEAHRVAGISWGKFNRLLCIEMRLHPDERMDSFNFLKMFRVELDRLIEQSPIIPDNIIKDFKKMFDKVDIVKPEIVGILNHTKVYKDSNSRLKRIAADATIALHYKRGVIKQIVVEDLDKRTRQAAIQEARAVAEEMFKQQQGQLQELAKDVAKETTKQTIQEQAKARASAAQTTTKPTLVEKRKEERTIELTKLATQNAGSVAALRDKFRDVIAPPAEHTPSTNTIDTVITIQNETVANQSHPPSKRVSISEDSTKYYTPVNVSDDEDVNHTEKV